MTASEQIFEPLAVEQLLDRVRARHTEGWRLVQIGVTRLDDTLEVTYSFDLKGRLSNLRVHIPTAVSRLPSVSGIYSCAFLYENEMQDLFNLEVEGMTVDFHYNLYKTTVKHAFASTKPPQSQPNDQGVSATKCLAKPEAAPPPVREERRPSEHTAPKPA
jgi:ech hydrogenase subunit D